MALSTLDSYVSAEAALRHLIYFGWKRSNLEKTSFYGARTILQDTWCLDLWARTFFACVATGLHFALSTTVAPCMQGTWCLDLWARTFFLHGLPRASILLCPPLWHPACRTPDVLTFEQGHFLHGLPRASILPCPPLWHPACRAPDVLTFEQGHFLRGLPRASILPCPPLWHPACRAPDVLTFEQGHFLHGLPRASILPCPPLWHPACRTPDVLTFEQGLFCMGCHGPPIEYKLYIYVYIYIYLEYCFCYIYIIYILYSIYIYRYLYFLIMTFNCWKIGKYLLDILVRCIQCLTWPPRQHHAETDWWAQKNGKNESQLGLAGLLQVTG